MSTVSGAALQPYFQRNPETGWYDVKTDAIQNKTQADLVSDACINDARMERLNAAAHFIMGGGMTLLASAATFIAAKIAFFVITILTFPLFIVPPLWSLVVTLGGMGAGLAVGMIIYKKYARQFFEAASNNWNHANHLYQQALAAELKGAAPRGG